MSELSKRLGALSPEKVALLSKRLKQQAEDAGRKEFIPRRNPATPVPLSLGQQRLWFLHQLDPESSFYNLSGAMRLKGRLQVAALERTLNEIVRRHESLRTSFHVVHDRPVQVIAPALRPAVREVDLSGLPLAERELRATRLANEEAQYPFDLTQESLLRVSRLRLGEEEHVLVIVMHHMISDGWSVGLFLRELVTLYTAFARGDAATLPEPSIQYGDYAMWQQEWLKGEAFNQQLAYWQRQLDGSLPVLDLPIDRPRPTAPTNHCAHENFVLPSSLVAALEALSRQEGVTLFAVLLAAYFILLYRYTGQQDINIGSPMAGRSRAETQDLIGFFCQHIGAAWRPERQPDRS